MAKVSKKIILKDVRASYANVLIPRAKLSGEGEEFSIQVIIPKDHPQMDLLKATITEVATGAFPGKPLTSLKLGLRDPVKEGKDTGALQGCMFFNARTKDKPQVIRGDKIVESGDDFYSGCYMNISIQVYDYDNSGNKGVTYGLGSIQFLRNGDRLDGRVSAFEEFDIIMEEEAETPAAPANDAATPAPVAAVAGDDNPW